jgi:hypothetical protein
MDIDRNTATNSNPAPTALTHEFEVWFRPDATLARNETQDWVAPGGAGFEPQRRQRTRASVRPWLCEPHLSGDEIEAYGKRVVNVFGSLQVVSVNPTPDGEDDYVGWRYHDALKPSGNLDRRLCTTERVYIGTVPSEAELGDEFSFSARGLGAVVIRLAADRGSCCFRLVGGCYLHGLMHGEAMVEGSGGIWRSLTVV